MTFTFKATDVRANNVKLLRYEAETLDKFWSDQEVLYDYNADIHGIGNQTVALYYSIMCIRPISVIL